MSILVVQLSVLAARAEHTLFGVISSHAIKLHDLDDVTNPMPTSLVFCVKCLERFIAGWGRGGGTFLPEIYANSDTLTWEDFDSNGAGESNPNNKKRLDEKYRQKWTHSAGT